MNIEKSNILITGGTGQVARALSKVFGANSMALGREVFDLSQPQSLEKKLDELRPGLIVNSAAYTQVDKAESESETAYLVNAESPKVMADWCAKNGAVLIHYSTDYVYPGDGEKPWHEDDRIAPLSVYGKSKAKGDEYIVESQCQYLIFRTSWVYDSSGKNFLNTILRIAQEKDTLKIVSDQIGAPTFAADIADLTLKIYTAAIRSERFPSGIYHLCNEGVTSWYEFAKTILAEAQKMNLRLKVKEVLPIASEEYPTPAKRPKNSRLAMTKLRNTFNMVMPSWQDALKRCLKEKLKPRFTEGLQ